MRVDDVLVGLPELWPQKRVAQQLLGQRPEAVARLDNIGFEAFGVIWRIVCSPVPIGFGKTRWGKSLFRASRILCQGSADRAMRTADNNTTRFIGTPFYRRAVGSQHIDNKRFSRIPRRGRP